MSSSRYVLLGLATTRSPWFRDVARWATSASLAAEFVKCLSAEEVRVRLASGRPHSALLIDTAVADFDRDLVAAAAAAGTPVIAVADQRSAGWNPNDLGVATVIDAGFDLDDLVEILGVHAVRIERADRLPPQVVDEQRPAWRGHLVAVCGPGGTGASTVAAALAQGLAADPRFGGRVLLADLALHADQAMLHDAPDLGPGLQEAVEAHRLGRPTPDELRSTTFDVARRGYQLLLGLRRPAAWSILRPRAVDATIDGMRRTWQMVVADVTGDVEGEDQGGSLDVEERNHLARAATSGASVVVAVGVPGLKGTHSLAALLRALLDHGVDPARLISVVNRSPRNPRAHAETSSALAAIVGEPSLSTPVFLPERKLEEALRDGTPLPFALSGPVVAAVRAVIDRLGGATPTERGPLPVSAGSLGSWTAQDAETP